MQYGAAYVKIVNNNNKEWQENVNNIMQPDAFKCVGLYSSQLLY